jgi:hypothetical protein
MRTSGILAMTLAGAIGVAVGIALDRSDISVSPLTEAYAGGHGGDGGGHGHSGGGDNGGHGNGGHDDGGHHGNNDGGSWGNGKDGDHGDHGDHNKGHDHDNPNPPSRNSPPGGNSWNPGYTPRAEYQPPLASFCLQVKSSCNNRYRVLLKNGVWMYGCL